jgi:ribosomal protein S18 acetylase RimI-like enzyme
LLRFCDHVVLNVRADNPPALAAYRRLGFMVHTIFEERLIHRIEPVWSGWTGAFRRVFAFRKESEPR